MTGIKEKNTKQLIAYIQDASYSLERLLDPELRRKTGSYYTSLDLTFPMVKELIDNLPKHKRDHIETLRFLEPCVGTGNFVFAYLTLASSNLTKDKVVELLNNIYVCDINEIALTKYQELLRKFTSETFGIELDNGYFESHVGKGLLFDVNADQSDYISIDTIFGENSQNSFDIIITNPPYKNLKAEMTHYESAEEKDIDKQRYKHIAHLAKQVLPLSSFGTLNLYKLFVEEIISRYSKNDATISLLIPSSILTDKTCEKMRATILKNHHIVSIKNIPENNQFIDAQQSLAALLINKKQPNTLALTAIHRAYTTTTESPVNVNLRLFATKENGYTIYSLNHEEFNILNKMLQFPRLKDVPSIINLRGELDLTANKSSISPTPTHYKLLRGKNIKRFGLSDIDTVEYVDGEFVVKSPKRAYISRERLICQQISNIAKDRRLNFAKINAGLVLANSCNFISVEENELGITLDYLSGLFNSKLMNWFFKIQSSNNHINNYEIDNFPIPVDNPGLIKQIADLAKTAQQTEDNQTTSELIDDLVSKLYGINKGDTMTAKEAKNTTNIPNIQLALVDLQYLIPSIKKEDIASVLLGQQTAEATLLKYGISPSPFEKNVINGIFEKYAKLQSNSILNHTTFKLSDLDLEMITPIPQGGNWKHIPTPTIMKSRRLQRITETGGRTTLYGRLNYEKPSYTITTYFNRPGNGTYVHPIHNRVLSVREAARLQAFPDDYYFYGNKTQLLKQIGNAVPALLAYQIGKKIVDKIGPATSLDLFCGAGGLTSGFKAAGIHTALCTDFNVAACTTIKINNPEAEVICGDITDDDVRESITSKATEINADIVCGGPPCQGFSMAGYRDKDDPRNQLFREFVAVVEKTRPKVVLFENVEGILTFNGGETYKAIHELFSELGYKTEGRLLKIDSYGVPQRRKRVIIICTRNDLDIDPVDLYPEETTGEAAQLKITVKDSIYDLEGIACSENAKQDETQKVSRYIKMLKKEISPNQFLESLMANPFTVTDNQTSLFVD
ncbi:MAG: Alw26I/Eco31I/Esp3I family type II restriction adenine-specific DNA-methyltransferase [Candidatus Microsaccharimonas sp.]